MEAHQEAWQAAKAKYELAKEEVKAKVDEVMGNRPRTEDQATTNNQEQQAA